MLVSVKLLTYPSPNLTKPSPALTQQESTDNKLGLMLCQGRARCAVAQILNSPITFVLLYSSKGHLFHGTPFLVSKESS